MFMPGRTLAAVSAITIFTDRGSVAAADGLYCACGRELLAGEKAGLTPLIADICVLADAALKAKSLVFVFWRFSVN